MNTHRGLLWFLAPSMLVLACVLVYPLGYALYLSLFDYYLAGASPVFIGLANYVALLGEPRFWGALWNTIVIVSCGVAIEFAVGLALALGLYRLKFGAHALMVLLFVPHIITPVVAALFLRWMFVGQWGLIDATMWTFGIATPDWLGSPFWAKVTVIIADTWKSAPFMMLVLYAGLQSLNQSVLEAARVDGANGWFLLTRIILPLLRPLVLFVLSIRIMDAFRFFDTIYVLTGGGPGTATETLTLYTYATGFARLEVGKASALGVLTLLIVAGLVATTISLLYRRDKGEF
ncbi:MAG: sugar ABC transporter permease [Bauldia sp.]|nr:sugar ABC transporter permease [Bauldia sp.]